jgi:hypothetical protein
LLYCCIILITDGISVIEFVLRFSITKDISSWMYLLIRKYISSTMDHLELDGIYKDEYIHILIDGKNMQNIVFLYNNTRTYMKHKLGHSLL